MDYLYFWSSKIFIFQSDIGRQQEMDNEKEGLEKWIDKITMFGGKMITFAGKTG